jgi:dihydrofolate reductase
MPRIKIFESVSANGFFAGDGGDLSWAYAHSGDAEFQRYVAGNASSSAALMFGRKTWEMMASYWPSPAARQAQPEVARGMTAARKLVFSRTLKVPGWKNAEIKAGDVKAIVGGLEQDAVVLGSGELGVQLLDAGLVDEVEVVVKPVFLGSGRPLFAGAKKPVHLELTFERHFSYGNVVQRYRPRR